MRDNCNVIQGQSEARLSVRACATSSVPVPRKQTQAPEPKFPDSLRDEEIITGTRAGSAELTPLNRKAYM